MIRWMQKWFSKFSFFKPASIILLGLSVIVASAMLLVRILLALNSSKGYAFLYKTIDYAMFMTFMMILFVALVAGVLVVALEIKIRYKLIIITATVLIVLFLLFGYSFENVSLGYHHFQSPDNTKTVVIHEEGWLWSGSISCYVKENAFFIKRLNGLIKTDGTYPGQFRFNWIDNENFSIEHGAIIYVNVNDVLSKDASATNFAEVK